MSALFVTVGTSGFENAEIGTAAGKSNTDLRKAVSDFKKDPDDWKDQGGVWGQLQGELVEAHEAFWSRDRKWVENRDHYRQTSAELISTYLLLKLLARRDAAQFDRVVLLASATPEGRFAAHVNRRVIQSPAYVRMAGGTWRNVDVKEVPGLTGDSDNMIQMLPPILTEGAGVVVRINMTGSYKGLAAALGFLAARMAAPHLHLFYLHEESEEPVVVLPEGNYQGVPPEVF